MEKLQTSYYKLAVVVHTVVATVLLGIRLVIRSTHSTRRRSRFGSFAAATLMCMAGQELVGITLFVSSPLQIRSLWVL